MLTALGFKVKPESVPADCNFAQERTPLPASSVLVKGVASKGALGMHWDEDINAAPDLKLPLGSVSLGNKKC